MWYNFKVNEEHSNQVFELEKEKIGELFSLAENLYNKFSNNYHSNFKEEHSESNYLYKLITSGTYGDKISALVLLVQNSPLYGLAYLRQLINMVKVGNHRVSWEAIEVLKELLISILLPSNRKLKTFVQQSYLPLLYNKFINMLEHNKQKIDYEDILIRVYFEHCLKREICEIFWTKIIEFTSDQIKHSKMRAIQILSELLVHIPECEMQSLKCLVQKLADTDVQVSQLAAKCLREQVLHTHPNMKIALLDEIQGLIFTKLLPHFLKAHAVLTKKQFKLHIKSKPKKLLGKNRQNGRKLSSKKGNHNLLLAEKKMHCIESSMLGILTFLRTSIPLEKSDSQFAFNLVRIYFGIFKEVLKSMATSTSNFNKCEPNEDITDEITSNKKNNTQQKFNQNLSKFHANSEFSPKLMNALFLCINQALTHVRFEQYSKGEVLQEINLFFNLANQSQFNNSIEILAFLHRVIMEDAVVGNKTDDINEIEIVRDATKTAPKKVNGASPHNVDVTSEEAIDNLKDRFYRCLYKKLLDPQFKLSTKQNKLFNLLYLSLQNDNMVDRIKAFLKRLLYISVNSSPAFTCATLIIIIEILKKQSLRAPSGSNNNNEVLRQLLGHWMKIDADTPFGNHLAEYPKFDMGVRDPKYAGNIEWFYELYLLMRHYHPSICIYATRLFNCFAPSTSKQSNDHSGPTDEFSFTLLDFQNQGDPLKNFSLHNFLENFLHKNPKNIDDPVMNNQAETLTLNSTNAKHDKTCRNLTSKKGVSKNGKVIDQIAARKLRESLRKIKKAKKQANNLLEHKHSIGSSSTTIHKINPLQSLFETNKSSKLLKVKNINFADEYLTRNSAL